MTQAAKFTMTIYFAQHLLTETCYAYTINLNNAAVQVSKLVEVYRDIVAPQPGRA